MDDLSIHIGGEAESAEDTEDAADRRISSETEEEGGPYEEECGRVPRAAPAQARPVGGCDHCRGRNGFPTTPPCPRPSPPGTLPRRRRAAPRALRTATRRAPHSRRPPRAVEEDLLEPASHTPTLRAAR